MLVLLLVVTVLMVIISIRSKRRLNAAVAERDEEIAIFKGNPANQRNGYYLEGLPKPIKRQAFSNYLPMWSIAIPLVLIVVILLATVITTVNAKSEGVLTTGGAISERTLDSGYNLKLPWQKNTQIDGRRKSDYFNEGAEALGTFKNAKDSDSDHFHGDIGVKYGDGGAGYVKAQIMWSPVRGNANLIYGTYRDDDPINNMRDNLVVPTFRSATYDTIRAYKPTAPIDALSIDFTDPEAVVRATKNMDLSPDLSSYADKVTDILADDPAFCVLEEGQDSDDCPATSMVLVEKVIISYFTLPKGAQEKIDEFLAETNNARIELARQATNTAKAEANRILSESLRNDPNILVSRCYDLVEAEKLVLQPGNSCWPGGDGLAGVIVQQQPTE